MNFTLPKEIKEKFSSRALSSISLAVAVSEKYKHELISPLHLLYGIFHTTGSLGSNLLKSYGFPEKSLEEELKLRKKTAKKQWVPQFSPILKDALKKAILASEKAKNNYVGSEHLLFAIISQKDDADMVKFLEKLEFPVVVLQEHLLVMTTQTPKFNNVSKVFDSLTQDVSYKSESAESKGPTPELDTYSQDITKLAKQNKLDPVIGREDEIDRMINILNRRLKNNPILVGDAGVGKTAIVEGLAQRIVKGKVPATLIDKRIVSLNLSSVLASTTFRGDFEGRLKKIMEEIEQDNNTILFIDEIHTMVGTGTSTGQSMDAANILKPALTRNYFKVIGATTPQEYFQYIEKDAALTRRFQKITVKEPSNEETYQILLGLKNTYESFYNVKIDDEALMTTIETSKRYINEGNLPDKAIDVIDEACSVAISKRINSPAFNKLTQAQNELKVIEAKKERSVAEENFEEAKLAKKEASDMKKKIKRLTANYKKDNEKKTISVDDSNIYKTIATITNIPAEKLQITDKSKFDKLDRASKKEIIGQDDVLDKMVKTLKRYKSGLADPNRPIGSFMFLGPSGVGKTESAKILAKHYFGSLDNLIRIDMTEFSERHQTSRLVGAPAGYVGYEEGGELTEKIKKVPYSVVLFDEIEKANRESINILMQILEDGVLSSAQGEKVHFNNALIIMTSNIGTAEFVEEAVTGFKTDNKEVEKGSTNDLEKRYSEIKKNSISELKDMLRPEFINRIDDILVFKPLGTKEITKIIKKQFNVHKARVKKELGIEINLHASALKYLTEKGFVPEYGARPIRRLLQNEIESLIAESVIEGTITPNSKGKKSYKIKADDKKLIIE